MKVIKAIITLTLGTVTLYAQELSLDQCRERALKHNNRIAIAAEQQSKATDILKAAHTAYFPKLSASGYAYYTTSEMRQTLDFPAVDLSQALSIDPSTVPPQLLPLLAQLPKTLRLPSQEFTVSPNRSYLAGVHIEQPIFMGGKIVAGNKMAEIGVEMSRSSKALTEAEVIVAADDAYHLCLQTQKLREVAATYLETVREFERVVGNAVKSGMRMRSDLLKVEVEKSKAEMQLLRAENAVKLARMSLCQVIGLPLESELQLTDSIQVDFPVVVGDVTLRPEYALLRQQIELKEQEKRTVRGDFLPTVGVRASYNYAYGLRVNDQLMMNQGGLSAIVSVSVPLFRWGEGVRRVRAAESEKRMVEHRLAEMSSKMALELRQATDSFAEADKEVELTARIFTQAREHCSISANRYAVGMETTADHLEAQSLLSKAEADHVIALCKRATAYTALLKAGGHLHSYRT